MKNDNAPTSGRGAMSGIPRNASTPTTTIRREAATKRIKAPRLAAILEGGRRRRLRHRKLRYLRFRSGDLGKYQLWLSTNSASVVFTGRPGHSYRFYRVAWDNVGNFEAAPTEPDAGTEVGKALEIGWQSDGPRLQLFWSSSLTGLPLFADKPRGLMLPKRALGSRVHHGNKLLRMKALGHA